MKHIKGLDTLRAFAILFVIIEHWGPEFYGNHPILAFLQKYFLPNGNFGVDLFFVLSGFLITSILLNAKADNHGVNRLLIIKNFIVRRALRIFPVYYLMLIFLLLIHYKGVQEDIWYLVTYTSNIQFYRNGAWGAIPHTWSLAVEEQFYLFWPWIILFVKEKYLKYVFILSITTSVISCFITATILHLGGYQILVYHCIGCFGMGGYYAYARMNDKRCRKFEKAFFPIFIICLFIYFYWKGPHDRSTTFFFRIVDGVIALQIIIAVIRNKREWVRKYVLENKAFNFIGRISYGIYLYHLVLRPIYDGFTGRLTLRHPGLPSIISEYFFSYAVKLILLILVSWLSYRFIEKPIISLKKQFKYKE